MYTHHPNIVLLHFLDKQIINLYIVMTTQGLLTVEPSKHYLALFLCSPLVFLKLMMASFFFYSLYFYYSPLVSKSLNISAKGLSVIFSICSSSSVPCFLPRASQEAPFLLHYELAGLSPNALMWSCDFSS